jgi:hypothetical protein
MLLTGIPQFDTQNDFGTGCGIPSIPEWYLNPPISQHYPSSLKALMADEALWNVFTRLRNVFERAQHVPLSTTQLHDLTCFVIHRLSPSDFDQAISSGSSDTECMRYGIIIYMLVVHGTTYYPHTFMLNQILMRFETQLAILEAEPRTYSSFDVWLLTVGMAASTGTEHYHLLLGRARAVAASLQLGGWNEITAHVKSVLWLDTPKNEQLFRSHWDKLWC